MKTDITRRGFLKVISALSLASLLNRMPGPFVNRLAQGSQNRPNIIIILFDAMSARHLSVYGYPRHTSPNLEKFARRATVYHTHRSAGTYTTPSSASLFTGTYPWTHRALCFGSRVLRRLENHNLFGLLHGTYQQIAFTQNLFADTLLYQFGRFIDFHEKLDSFTTAGKVAFNKLFSHDPYYASKSFDQFLFKTGEVHGSLFLSLINEVRGLVEKQMTTAEMADLYPFGLPNLPALDHTYFNLSQVMDGVIGLAGKLATPSFAYFHFLAPHDPYKPTRQYMDLFNDKYSPPAKEKHPLSGGIPDDILRGYARNYDQYIANIDDEFGRLADYLDKSGLMENSYVIVTSDHGELFERGILGHGVPFAYEPLLRIPLMISSPGQRDHRDIYAPTINIDLLPTFLHLSDLPIPDWAEGRVLPGLGGEEASDRSIFAVDAKENSEFTKLRKGTASLVKGDYKIIRYFGYQGEFGNSYEFYDIKKDPDELQDQYGSHPAAKDLQFELDHRLDEVNQSYPA